MTRVDSGGDGDGDDDLEFRAPSIENVRSDNNASAVSTSEVSISIATHHGICFQKGRI